MRFSCTFTIDGTAVELAEGDYLRVEPGVTGRPDPTGSECS
jgi:quercetin dioxygenase-like cupin family protein